MNYKFIKKGIDDYELHFTDKEGKEVVKPFKNKIEEAKMLDSINIRARIKLMDNMKSLGKTKDDFIDKKIVDGKTIIDESRYLDLERGTIEDETSIVLDKCIESAFGENIINLYKEMGVDLYRQANDPQIANDIANFTAKFTAVLTGTDEVSPSGEVYYKGEIKS